MSCYWITLSTKLPLVPLTVAVMVANPVPPSRVPMIGMVVVALLVSNNRCVAAEGKLAS
jgi:hypothetical protein